MSEIKRRWEQLLLDADPDYQRWLDDLDRQTQEFQEQQEQQNYYNQTELQHLKMLGQMLMLMTHFQDMLLQEKKVKVLI